MAKLNFDEALEALHEQRSIDRASIQARALTRKVWVAEWHLPGCISESFNVCTSKREAIESALFMAEGLDGSPRGMRADLERFGRSDRVAPNAWARGAITTVYRARLADLF
jgi:hypothetical protein